MTNNCTHSNVLSTQAVRTFFFDNLQANNSNLSLEVLHAEPLAGNICNVYCFDKHVFFEKRFKNFIELENTYCMSYLITNDHTNSDKKIPTVSVLCYEKDKKIQCCGHGMLATAFCWMQILKTPALQFNYADTKIFAEQKEDIIWLRFPQVNCQVCELPEWLPMLFPQLKVEDYPIRAACTSALDGYLVLEWPTNTDLSQLPAVTKAVVTFTRRAVIFTARQKDSSVDIQLRYFAPQYSQQEDAATGSAVRILSSYWSPFFTRFVAQQRSEKGGLLMARFLADSKEVAVGGYCQLVEDMEYA